MFLSLLLCVLAACVIPPGQGQVYKECYFCKVRFLSSCYFTSSQVTQCPDDSSCGTVRYLSGTDVVFTTSGCVLSSECNRSATLTGVARTFSYNATCCNSNYCNGGFGVQASHVTLLASLGSFLFYIIS